MDQEQLEYESRLRYERSFLWTEDIVVEEDTIWFFSGGFNGLFCASLKDGRAKLVDIVPDESLGAMARYYAIAKYKNKILLAPGWANDIVLYDIEAGVFQRIGLNLGKEREKYGCLFQGNIQLRQYMVLFGYGFPGIVRFNMETDECKIVPVSLEGIPVIFAKGTCLVGNKAYAVCITANKVCEFDIFTGEVIFYDIPVVKHGGISSICYHRGKFWMTSCEEGVIMWDKETMQMESYIEYPEDFNYESTFFRFSLGVGEEVWLVPAFANMIVAIDNFGKMRKVDLEFGKESFTIKAKLVSKYLGEYHFAKADEEKGRVLLGYYDTNEIAVVDVATGHIDKMQFRFPKEDKHKYIACLNRDRLIESESVQLKDLIDAVIDFIPSKKEAAICNVGEAIMRGVEK